MASQCLISRTLRVRGGGGLTRGCRPLILLKKLLYCIIPENMHCFILLISQIF